MQRSLSSFVFGLLLLSGTILGGCALNDAKEGTAAREALLAQRSSPENHDPDAIPDGYPYPPKELWRRVKQVIKTPPNELSYQKFGQIFGIEFDEEKIFWYRGSESKDIFSVNRLAIRDGINFPFHEIKLSKDIPDKDTGARVMRFDIDVYENTPSLALRPAETEKYCIKPERSEIEALGFFFEPGWQEVPIAGYNLRPPQMYYELLIFTNRKFGLVRPEKRIYLDVLRNGCLIRATYSLSFK